jgi:hypothetical protein
MASSEGVEASGGEVLDALKRFEHQHRLDPNLPADEVKAVDTALANGDTEKALEVEVALVEDDSPYPEV